MKLPLLLLLLLLGTVAALHQGNDVPYPDSQESQADLSQDLKGSGEQEGESILTEEAIQSEGKQVEASSCQDAFEDKEAMESYPGALDENLQCPREEDTVKILGSPGCKTCRYVLVRARRTFRGAQKVCRRCYRGNLVSIHNHSVNYQLQCLASKINQQQVWIGGKMRGWYRRLHWIDGSAVNFSNWAHHHGRGCCVALCTRGGRWRRKYCISRLPFICSY